MRSCATIRCTRAYRFGSIQDRVLSFMLAITLEDIEYLAPALLEGARDLPVAVVRPSAPFGLNCNVVVSERPAGTTETAISLYDDAALVETYEGEPGGALDMVRCPVQSA